MATGGDAVRRGGWLRETGVAGLMIQRMPSVDLGSDESLRALIDQYRARCLWFLREGYYPATTDEVLRVLDAIERHGDVDAFKRAGALRQWVSASSNAASASS